MRYYTTVEACNGAGLCVTVTSDGIIVDTSPPVAGVVYDGISAEDIDYHSSRYVQIKIFEGIIYMHPANLEC